VTVNKRLLFGSLAVAIATVVTVGVIQASRTDPAHSASDGVTLTSDNDLVPPIATNALVTGRSLPKVNVRTLNGDTFVTAELIGRPLVINFWNSTCLPCKKELPAFAAAHDKLGEDVRIVGVDTLAPSTEEEAFARDRGVQYELFYDPDGELTTVVGVAALPQTLFIDASGKIVAQTGQLTADRLTELIRTKLL
jgi:thiol-disulfide isomerase/thioredoxin